MYNNISFPHKWQDNIFEINEDRHGLKCIVTNENSAVVLNDFHLSLGELLFSPEDSLEIVFCRPCCSFYPEIHQSIWKQPPSSFLC